MTINKLNNNKLNNNKSKTLSKTAVLFLILFMAFAFSGCSNSDTSSVPTITNAPDVIDVDISTSTNISENTLIPASTLTPTQESLLENTLTPLPTVTLAPALTPALTPSSTKSLTPTNTPNPETGIISTYVDIPIEDARGFICLNPGHQGNSNTQQEPVGPGSNVTKKKVSYGAAGTLTGRESVLNLKVALILRNILGERGYKVLLTRETEKIDISNIERTMLANENGCDILIHLHHNSSSNEAKKGAETICSTKNNPYHPELFEESYLLAKLVIDAVCEKTDFVNKGVYLSNSYTSINWSEIPVIFTELGYLSNAEDDEYLSKNENIYLMCEGIANGIDKYFDEKNK